MLQSLKKLATICCVGLDEDTQDIWVYFQKWERQIPQIHTGLGIVLMGVQMSAVQFDFLHDLVYLTKAKIIFRPEMYTKQVFPS